MAHKKSAMKRDRQAKKAHVANVAVRSALRSARRTLFEVVEKGDKAGATTALRAYASILDKSAKKRVIKKNAADRRKSRAQLKIAAMA